MTCCIVLINAEATAAPLPPLTSSSSEHSSATTGLLSQRNSEQTPKAEGAQLKENSSGDDLPPPPGLGHTCACHCSALTAGRREQAHGRSWLAPLWSAFQSFGNHFGCRCPAGCSVLEAACRPGSQPLAWLCLPQVLIGVSGQAPDTGCRHQGAGKRWAALSGMPCS